MNNTNTVCTLVDPTAPQAKMGFDAFLMSAYVCILLSYININILIFRFWIIMSAIMFICWAFVPERALQIDTLIFNLIFIIINILQSVPLVKQIWPVTLTTFEEMIYSRDFAGQMSKKQFKRFIDNFKTQKYQAHNSQLCVIESDFEALIYIAKINPGWDVCLRNNRNDSITRLGEGSWIGTIEYMFDKENNTSEPIKWGITAVVEKIPDFHQEDENGNAIIQAPKAECIVYIIELSVCFY